MIHPGVCLSSSRVLVWLFLYFYATSSSGTGQRSERRGRCVQHSVARRRRAERVHSSTLSVSKWWLQETAVGLQSSFRRTGEEFAFMSTGEVKTPKQASGHAETAELSLEAGEMLSGG